MKSIKVTLENKKCKKFIVVGTLVLASIILLLILPLGHDLWYHIYRIGTMASELQKNPWQLPVRMLADSYNGYGYGAALYYGDLFLYIPAVLICLGLDEVLAYKIFTVLILWGTFLIAYRAARLIKRKEEIALDFAVFYTFSSCGLLNLCVRSAIGESLAFMFLPLVAASFGNILYGKRESRNWVLLGISMSVVAMSHMLTLALSAVVLCIWCLLENKKVFIEKKVIDILKAAGFMIGLSASFLFPMFEQMLFQKVQTPGNNDYQKQAFMDYAVEWMDYFIPYEVKKILVSLFSISWNIETWHPGTIGLFGFIVIGTIILLKPVLNKKQIGIVVCSLSALVLLGITPVMDLVKEFAAFMQFPWRVLPLITLGLSFSGIWILENAKVVGVKKKKIEWCMMIGTLLIAVWAIGPRYAYQIYVQRDDYAYIQENNPDFYEKYKVCYDKNAGDALYLPEGVPLSLYLERGEVVVANTEEILFDWQRTQNEINIHIRENECVNGVLELPLYMYKGYVAKNADGENLSIVKSENGLVSVEIGDSVGEVSVWYQGTLVQKISDMVTLLTILSFLCGYRIIVYKSKRVKKCEEMSLVKYQDEGAKNL